MIYISNIWLKRFPKLFIYQGSMSKIWQASWRNWLSAASSQQRTADVL
jgi:hypothetical protein